MPGSLPTLTSTFQFRSHLLKQGEGSSGRCFRGVLSSRLHEHPPVSTITDPAYASGDHKNQPDKSGRRVSVSNRASSL